jgi:hypothetical protein
LLDLDAAIVLDIGAITRQLPVVNFAALGLPFVLALTVVVIVPVRLPRGIVSSGRSDPLTQREHLVFVVPFLVVAFGIGLSVSFVLHELLRVARPPGVLFANHLADLFSTAALPSLFISIPISAAITFRFWLWRLRERIGDYLDRPDRARPQMSLRQSIKYFRPLLWSITAVSTLFLALAMHTFFVVTADDVVASGFFELTQRRIPVSTVRFIDVVSSKRAPIGTVVHRPWLRLQFEDGTDLDTYNLIEPSHVSLVIHALQSAHAFGGTVRRLEGPDL